MNIKNLIVREIKYINFVLCKYLINKSFKKIHKLKRELDIETKYHNALVKGTLELIEQIKY